MIMKQCPYIGILISLSGLLSLLALTAVNSASHRVETLSVGPLASTTAAKEDTGTLRQGLPGRRLNGGTRAAQTT